MARARAFVGWQAATHSRAILESLRSLEEEVASSADAGKLSCMREALQRGAAPFADTKKLPDDAEKAVAWSAARSAAQACRDREHIISQIEQEGAALRTRRGVRHADATVAAISRDVNVPLFEELAKRANHTDLDCTRFFIEEVLRAAPAAPRRKDRLLPSQGAPVIGQLPASGNGVPHKFDAPVDVADLDRGTTRWHVGATASLPRAGALKNNQRLLASLRDDEFEETLYKQALEEAALGRLSPPLSADANMDLSDIIIAQRFGVAQGLKADGTPKAACAFTRFSRGRNTHTRAGAVR